MELWGTSEQWFVRLATFQCVTSTTKVRCFCVVCYACPPWRIPLGITNAVRRAMRASDLLWQPWKMNSRHKVDDFCELSKCVTKFFVQLFLCLKFRNVFAQCIEVVFHQTSFPDLVSNCNISIIKIALYTILVAYRMRVFFHCFSARQLIPHVLINLSLQQDI